MDSQTNKELQRITQGTPRRLVEGLMKEEVDNSMEYMAREALKGHSLSSKERRNLEEMIERGAFRRVEKIEDPKIIKELDAYNEYMVDRARRQGKLADPRSDKFYVARMKRLKAMKK